ncbi:hypothetical protein UPYG_G00163150 [Umbra pygmaea]|uniref:Ankyrin repeat domain-containing protein 60 n=1 Tax=Umbra pygmaea TaxID=75934 RepID=A0ABD0XCF2_UMBPY
MISLYLTRHKSNLNYRKNASNNSVRPKSLIHRDRSIRVKFSLSARLCETGEMFVVHNCHYNMTIRELKHAMELIVGIPTDFLRVCYLDRGDLKEETTINYNDIIPGTAVTLMIWPYNGWGELVAAAATGDVFKLKHVISKPEPQCCCRPRSKGSVAEASSWLSYRLFSALFISAHRGHLPAVRFLLQNGADVKSQTPLGCGALHVAAAQGHVHTILELLLHGAPLDMEDAEGRTALSIARCLHQKRSLQQLSLFQWRERAQGMRLKPHLDQTELFAHQKHDSKLRPFYQGVHGQRYTAHLGHYRCGVEGVVGVRKLEPPRNTALRA